MVCRASGFIVKRDVIDSLGLLRNMMMDFK